MVFREAQLQAVQNQFGTSNVSKVVEEHSVECHVDSIARCVQVIFGCR
jgi:hypothetical protein